MSLEAPGAPFTRTGPGCDAREVVSTREGEHGSLTDHMSNTDTGPCWYSDAAHCPTADALLAPLQIIRSACDDDLCGPRDSGKDTLVHGQSSCSEEAAARTRSGLRRVAPSPLGVHRPGSRRKVQSVGTRMSRGQPGNPGERSSVAHAGRLGGVDGGRGESGSIRSVSGATPGYTSQLVPASGAARHAPRATRHRRNEVRVASPAGHDPEYR